MVGRGPDCDVILETSTRVSRMHCAFVQVDKQYYVRDLGSMNGVWIGHQRIVRDYELSNGEMISIGDLRFCFQDGMPDTAVEPPQKTGPLATFQIQINSPSAADSGTGSGLQFPDNEGPLRVELHDQYATPDCDDSATLQDVPRIESSNNLLDPDVDPALDLDDVEIIDDDVELALDLDDVEIIDDDAELD